MPKRLMLPRSRRTLRDVIEKAIDESMDEPDIRTPADLAALIADRIVKRFGGPRSRRSRHTHH